MPANLEVDGESPFSALAHVSIAVKDIKAAVSYYESLGIGPFSEPADHEFAIKTYRGHPLESTLIIREAKVGPVVIQLVEHIQGDCVVKEYLDRKGPGVYHLGFLVKDVNLEQKRLEEAGVEVLQSGRRKDNSGYAYFDTEKKAGVILEIKQMPFERETE